MTAAGSFATCQYLSSGENTLSVSHSKAEFTINLCHSTKFHQNYNETWAHAVGCFIFAYALFEKHFWFEKKTTSM